MARRVQVVHSNRQEPSVPDTTNRSVLVSASDLLMPEVIIAEQGAPRFLIETDQEWVFALREAVLRDAIDCFQKRYPHGGRHAPRLSAEAEAWLFADDNSWPFSCANVCAALNVEIEALRCMLTRWAQQQSNVPAPGRPRARGRSQGRRLAA